MLGIVRERGGTNVYTRNTCEYTFVPPSPELQLMKQQPHALNKEALAGEGGQGDEGL